MRTIIAVLSMGGFLSSQGIADSWSQDSVSGASQSPLASRVEKLLEDMRETLYQSKTEIDEETGSLRCDCSGFIGYVLRNYFPEAYLSLRGDESPWRTRPYAVTYYETFVASGHEGNGPGGWRRIKRMMDVRPGDVLAWRKRTIKKGTSTGHTCMIAGMPVREADGRVRVRVIDSTNVRHANDTRPTGTTGVGAGDMWFTVDEEGEPTGFFVNEHKTKPSLNKVSIGRLIVGNEVSVGVSGENSRKPFSSLPEDSHFIGLTKNDAVTLAEESGHLWRVILQDGVVSPVSMGIREDRVNFVIEKGKVVRVRRG